MTGHLNCIAFKFQEEGENEKSSIKGDNKDERPIDDYFYSDIANSVIYWIKPISIKPEVLIRDFEGNPLIGPTLIFKSEDNSILFCDGGFFDPTSLINQKGSVYHFDLEVKQNTYIR